MNIMNIFILAIKIEWETILAIIGALAWIPWIYDKATPSKIYGHLISNVMNQGNFNNKDGTLHFIKLSLTCMNKNFNVHKTTIRVKYINNDTWYNGKTFWARRSSWVIDPTQNISKQLVIPNEDFLGFTNMFEKDKSKFYYLTFLVEKDILEEFEIIGIDFEDPNGTTRTVEFRSENIDTNNILFDDSIWR
jgi:hypothetical protein